jgi:gamma-glutamyltranspeptidase/glutathione hydrolase
MNLREAGDAPRFYRTKDDEPTGTVMRNGGVPHLESGDSQDVRMELLRRGHLIAAANDIVFGGYRAIWRDPKTGVQFGATESRKDGLAAGY